MIAEFQEKYFELLEENKKHRREIHRLNKELLKKNELSLACLETVDAQDQTFAEQLSRARVEKKEWKQAYEKMSEKCERQDHKIFVYEHLLRLHNIKFEESTSNDAPQEQEVKLIKSLDARHYIGTNGWD
ncbi:MAG: hypothetical protein OXG15_01390 [Gammaproteobacteria bacterium]|nr:hypothetical protein [Gammaproteobacteria bacterium]